VLQIEHLLQMRRSLPRLRNYIFLRTKMTRLLPALYIPKGYVSQLGRYATYEQLMVGCVEPEMLPN
jgi:hypothetical protein